MNVTQKHRILYVITKANWGGAQRYVFDMATSAREQGHEVLVAVGSDGDLVSRLVASGVPTVSVRSMQRDFDLWKEFRVAHELRDIIHRFRPTVVHGNSSKAGGVVSFIARLMNVPRIIFTAHGWAFNEDRPRWQKLLIWFAHYGTVLLSHTTICNSEATYRDARSMPLAKGHTVVIHLGVSEATLLTREDARHLLAPHISFPLWIGTIAELHPVKRIDTLIRAFSKIKDAHPTATLVIMGEGQERLRLEALIRDLGLESRVRLRGHVDQAQSYMNALDLFVLSSRSEGLGYVLLEAGLAGLPVVASNVGGIPEVIEHDVTGLLVPPGDPDALADALIRCLADSALRSRLSSTLRARVLKDFSKKAMVERTLALY